jgi:hypothetical protein
MSDSLQTHADSHEARPLDGVVRRRLIMDFFSLGPIHRWDVCDKGKWLTETDLRALQNAPDQELWALAFKRAEERGELEKMRELVATETPNSKFNERESA